MKIKSVLCISVLGFASTTFAEEATPDLPDVHFNYANIELPEHYLTNSFSERARSQTAAINLDNTPTDNPITDAGATLGRVLFYDKKLSANGSIACASCHLPEFGFSDPKTLSIGFDGEQTRRHSTSLTNATFYDSGKFFWDERADSLEEQVLMPFQDDIEMGLTLARLEEIVREQPYYSSLFEDAFGNAVVSSERISKALAQFIRSMVSTTSKYDVARANEDSLMDRFSGFTRIENRGKSLFYRPQETEGGRRVSCSGCHISEAFVGRAESQGRRRATTAAVSNGLDAQSTSDLGVFEATGNNRDIGKFKTPSLRNVGVSAPYMHDGRFATLEDVIEHYSSGIQAHPNLPRQLREEDGSPVRFNFTADEKEALVAFLHTLTDQQMLTDEKYSDPFL